MFRTFGTATITDQPVLSLNSRFSYAGRRLFSRSGTQWSEFQLPGTDQCDIQAISADGKIFTGLCAVPPKTTDNSSLSILTKDTAIHLDKMDGFSVDQESALSPDGSKLAFCLSSSMATRTYTLDVKQCLANPASCGANRQGPLFGCPRYMAWSPDNSKIVHDDLPDIKVYDFATGTDTVVDHDEYLKIIHSITWSPDGKFIAYSADDSRSFGQGVIKVYSFNTGKVNTMVTSDQLLLVFGWLTVPEE
jgi:Tol biopolymer transport system component